MYKDQGLNWTRNPLRIHPFADHAVQAGFEDVEAGIDHGAVPGGHVIEIETIAIILFFLA